MYRLNADILNLQEVAFGPRMLNELIASPDAPQRHSMNHIGIPLRRYRPYLAPVQLQLFEVWRDTPDPDAQLDGNVILTDQARFTDISHPEQGFEFEVVSNAFLQLSGVRNC